MQSILGVFVVEARREENHLRIGVFQNLFGQVQTTWYRWLQQNDVTPPRKASCVFGRTARSNDGQVFRSRNSLHDTVPENWVDIDDTNTDLVNHRLSPCPKD